MYTLEKVLRLKKDPGTGVMFLDEAMKVRLLEYEVLESNGNRTKKAPRKYSHSNVLGFP